MVYANDCDGQYPPGDKWCDLLIEYDFTTKKQFLCIDARRRGDQGPSHYAINPNATADSPADLVLVFETKGGWNQSGGPEILAIRKHYGGRKGCNVGFVDGHVRFVQQKDLGKLKWK
jgi:prepilin-type processing-associated H-X9-DG protein